jgi:hypothetical protein
MAKSNASDTAQQWIKTDTTSGFPTYKSVKFGRCRADVVLHRGAEPEVAHARRVS